MLEQRELTHESSEDVAEFERVFAELLLAHAQTDECHSFDRSEANKKVGEGVSSRFQHGGQRIAKDL